MMRLFHDEVASAEPTKTRSGPAWSLLKDVAMSGQQERPFLVCDVDQIRENLSAWKEELPNIRPFYDVFCNSCSLVLKVLSEQNCGFVCRSKEELKAALHAGVQPGDIFFKSDMLFGPNLKFAARSGVGMVSFSSQKELSKIKKTFPEANLVLSIDLSQKNDAFLELLRVSSAAGMKVIGVSFSDKEPWTSDLVCRKMAAMAKLAFIAGKSLGHGDMSVVDVGTPNIDQGEEVKMLQSTLTSSLQQQFGNLFPNLSVIGHTTDALVSPAFKLAVKVLGKRIARADPDGLRSYILNDGVYGCFGRALMDEDAKFSPVPLRMASGKDVTLLPSDLWGPSGDDLDLIGRRIPLPDVEEDDWLVFEGMGAHLMATGAMADQLTAFEAAQPGRRDLWLLVKTPRAALSDDDSSPLSSPEGPSLSSSFNNLNDPNIFHSLPFASFTLDFDADGNGHVTTPAGTGVVAAAATTRELTPF